MASVRGELRLETRGMADCELSLKSIREAACNAYLDDIPLDCADAALHFEGMAITEFRTWIDDCTAIVEIRPTASMILFIGWLMTQLPSRASVHWRNGWPFVHCPPNEDRDHKDSPMPRAPDELELA